MSTTQAALQFRAFIERIERLEEDRKAIADDIADVFKELKGAGFDKDAAKTVLKVRRTDGGLAQYHERSAIVDVYLAALGMLPADEADRAPARAREIIEEFPTASPASAEADAPSPAPGASATISDDEIPDFVKKPFARPVRPLRPHCLNPGLCAGTGSKHCHSCTKALGEAGEPA